MKQSVLVKPKKNIVRNLVVGIIAMLGVLSFGISNVKSNKAALGKEFSLQSRSTSNYEVVTTPEDLAIIARRVNDEGKTDLKILLNAHINIGGKIWTPIGNEQNKFKGVFDGNGYSISNLLIDDSLSSSTSVGLFGDTENATIKDLILISPAITSSGEKVGTLVGRAQSTTIMAVAVEGGIVKNTKASGSVHYTGGIVGLMDGGNLYNSYSTTEISASTTSGGIGGIVGEIKGTATVENTYFNGKSSGDGATGGIFGKKASGSLVKYSYYLFENKITNKYSYGRYNNNGALQNNASEQSKENGETFVTQTLNVETHLNGNWIKMTGLNLPDEDKMPHIRGVGNQTIVLQEKSEAVYSDFKNNESNINYFSVQSLKNSQSAGNLGVTLSVKSDHKISGILQTWDYYTVLNFVPGTNLLGENYQSRHILTGAGLGSNTDTGSVNQKFNNSAETITINGAGSARQGYYPVEVATTARYFLYKFKVEDLNGNNDYLFPTAGAEVNIDFSYPSGYSHDIEVDSALIKSGKTNTIKFTKNKEVNVYAQPEARIDFGINSITVNGYHSPKITANKSTIDNANFKITLKQVDGASENVKITLSDLYELHYPNVVDAEGLWNYSDEYGGKGFDRPTNNIFISYNSLNGSNNKYYSGGATATSFAFPQTNGRTFNGWAVGSVSGIIISSKVEQGQATAKTGSSTISLTEKADRENFQSIIIDTLEKIDGKLTYKIDTTKPIKIYATWHNNTNNIEFGGYYLNMTDDWEKKDVQTNLNNGMDGFFELKDSEVNVSFKYKNIGKTVIKTEDNNGNPMFTGITLENQITIEKGISTLGMQPYAIVIKSSSPFGSSATGTLGDSYQGAGKWGSSAVWYYSFGSESSASTIYLNHAYDSLQFYVLVKRADATMNVFVESTKPDGVEQTGFKINYKIVEIDGETIEEKTVSEGGKIEGLKVGQNIVITSLSVSNEFTFLEKNVKDRIKFDTSYEDLDEEEVKNFKIEYEQSSWIIKGNELYKAFDGITGVSDTNNYEAGVYTELEYNTVEFSVYLTNENFALLFGADAPTLSIDATNGEVNGSKVSRLHLSGAVALTFENQHYYEAKGISEVYLLNNSKREKLANKGVSVDIGQNGNEFVLKNFEGLKALTGNISVIIVFKKVEYTIHLVTEKIDEKEVGGFEQGELEILEKVYLDATNGFTVDAMIGYYVKSFTFSNLSETSPTQSGKTLYLNSNNDESVRSVPYTLNLMTGEGGGLKTFVKDKGGKVFYIIAKYGIKEVDYEIQYFYETLTDGEYEINESETESASGNFGEVIEITPKVKFGFTYNKEKSVDELTLKETDNVFKLYYSRNVYEIKYDGNGNTGGTAPETHNEKWDEDFTIKENTFTKTGHNFVGWNIEGENIFEEGETTNLKSIAGYFGLETRVITFYAQWEPKEITADWIVPSQDNDWSDWTNTKGFIKSTNTTLTSTMTYGRSYLYVGETTNSGLLSPKTNERYQFLGWFIDNEGEAINATDLVLSETDIEIFAKWEPIPVRIMFEVENNGIGLSFDEKQIIIADDGSTTFGDADINGNSQGMPEFSNNKGFNFVGWYKEGQETEITAETKLVFSADAIVLYGRWEVAEPEIVNDENWNFTTTYDDTKASIPTLEITFEQENNAYIENSNELLEYTYQWYRLVGEEDVEVSGQTSSVLNLKDVSDSGQYRVKVTAKDRDGVWGESFSFSKYGTVTIQKQKVEIKIKNNKISKVYDGTTTVSENVFEISVSDKSIFSIVGNFDNANVKNEKNVTFTITLASGKNASNFAFHYKDNELNLSFNQNNKASFSDKIGEITPYILSIKIKSIIVIATGSPYFVSANDLEITQSQKSFLLNNAHTLAGGVSTINSEPRKYTAPAGFVDELTILKDGQPFLEDGETPIKSNYNIVLSGDVTIDISEIETVDFIIEKHASLDKTKIDSYTQTNQGKIEIKINGVDITQPGVYSVDDKYVSVSILADGSVKVLFNKELTGEIIFNAVGFKNGQTNTEAQAKNWTKGIEIFSQAEIKVNLENIQKEETLKVYYRNYLVLHYHNLLDSNPNIVAVDNVLGGQDITHSALSESGLNFVGWYDSTLANAKEIATNLKGVADINVYAKWTLEDIQLKLFDNQTELKPNSQGKLEISKVYDGKDNLVIAEIENLNSANINYTYTWTGLGKQETPEFYYRNASKFAVLTILIEAKVEFKVEGATVGSLQKTIEKKIDFEVKQFAFTITEHFEKDYDGTTKLAIDGKEYFARVISPSENVFEEIQFSGNYPMSQAGETTHNLNVSTKFDGEDDEYDISKNYIFTFVVTGKINKKQIQSINIGAEDKNYKDYDAKVLEKTISGGIEISEQLVLNDKITIKFKTVSADAGLYQANIELGDLEDLIIIEITLSNNYYHDESLIVIGSARINQVEIDASLFKFEDKDQFEYDGTGKRIKIISTLPVNVQGEYSWYNNANSQEVYHLDENDENPNLPINVGDYTFVYTLVVSETNYKIKEGTNPITKGFSIVKRKVEVDFGYGSKGRESNIFENQGIKTLEINSSNVEIKNKTLLSDFNHQFLGIVITKGDKDGIYGADNLEFDFTIKQGNDDVSQNYEVVFKGDLVIEHRYMIVFHVNNGIDPEKTAERIMINNGINISLPSVSLLNFEKIGYDFVEWNTKADGSGVEYEKEFVVQEALANNNEELHLYAIWQVGLNRFVIQYNFEDIESGFYNNDTQEKRELIQNNIYTENYILLEREESEETGFVYTLNVYETKQAFLNNENPIISEILQNFYEGFYHITHSNENLEGVIAPDGSLTLNLYMTRKLYVITYDFNNNEEDKKIKYKYEEQITEEKMPPNPVRAGYSFAMWTIWRGTTIYEKLELPFQVKANNESFRAEYFANNDTSFDVELYYQDLNGEYDLDEKILLYPRLQGTTDATINIDIQDDDAVFYMTGHNGAYHTISTPKGFHLDTSAENVLTGEINAEAEQRLVLKIYYARNEYTYTQQLNNENETGEDIIVIMLHGNKVAEPTNPSYTGYTFVGWYKEITLNTQITSWNFEIESHLTIYAKYRPNTTTEYKIYVYMEEMSGGYPQEPIMLDKLTATTGFTATVVENADGEFLEVQFSDGETILSERQRIPQTLFDYYGFEIDDSFTESKEISRLGDTVINLYLKRVYFDVTLKMEYEEEKDQVVQIKYEHDFTQGKYNLPISSSHTFASWYLSKSYTLNDKVELPLKITQDQTLYARWFSNEEIPVTVEIYLQQAVNNEITDYLSQANETQPLYVPLGSFIVIDKENKKLLFYNGDTPAPVEPAIESLTQELVKKGYTFDHESLVENGDKDGHPIISENKNTVIKLYFKLNEYKFTTNKNNGEDDKTEDVFYTQKPQPIEAPEKQGYIFAGWYKDDQFNSAFTYSTFTMPDHEVTIYAKWDEANDTEFKVSYYLENLPESDETFEHSETITYKNTTNRKVRLSEDGNQIEILNKVDALEESITLKSFIGFFLDKTIEGSVIETTVVFDGSGELKLYFRRNKSTLTLDFGYSADDISIGEKVSFEEIESIYYNFEQKIEKPERAGYAFNGWFSDANKQIKVATREEDGLNIFTMPHQDTTLWAGWIAEKSDFVVEYYFEKIDETGFVLDETKTSTHQDFTGKNVLSKSFAYGIMGFTYSSETTTESGIVGAYQENKLVLKLYYTRNTYSLHFDGKEGATDTMESMDFKYEEARPLTLNNFKKEFYVFDGWATSKDTIQRAYLNGNTYKFTATQDMTLYALWKVVEGDKPVIEIVESTNKVAYGDEITLRMVTAVVPENATIEYYWRFIPKGETQFIVLSHKGQELIINQIAQSGEYFGYIVVIIDGERSPDSTHADTVAVEVVERKVKIDWANTNFVYSARAQAPSPQFVLLDLDGETSAEPKNVITLPKIATALFKDSNSISEATTVGEYTIKANFELSSNFEFVGIDEVDFEITHFVWSVDIEQGQFSERYGTVPSKKEWNYKLVNEQTAETVTIYLQRINTETQAGFYNLSLKTPSSDNANYIIEIEEENKGFEITKTSTELILEFKDVASFFKIYDGEEVDIETLKETIFASSNLQRYMFPNEEIKFEKIEFEIAGNSKNVGSYVIELVEYISLQYEEVKLLKEYTFEIRAKEITINAEEYKPEKTFDALTEIRLDVSRLTGVIEEDIEKLSLIGFFENANAGNDKNISLAQLEGEESANYTVVVPSGSLKGNILQRKAKVVALENTIVYGEYESHILQFEAFAQDLETEQFSQKLSIDLFRGNLSASLEEERVGSFEITRGSLEIDANYIIEEIDSNHLLINKKEIHITSGTWNKIYDGTTAFIGEYEIHGMLEKDINEENKLIVQYSQSDTGTNIEIFVSIESGFENYKLNDLKYYGSIEQAFVTMIFDYKIETLETRFATIVSTGTTQSEVAYGSEISILPTPRVTGYIFDGWYTLNQENEEIEVKEGDIIGQGMGWTIELEQKEFFAKWQEGQVDLVVNVIIKNAQGTSTYQQENFEDLSEVVVTVKNISLFDLVSTKHNFNALVEVVAKTNPANEFEYEVKGWFFSASNGGENPVPENDMFEIDGDTLSITMLGDATIFVLMALKSDMLVLDLDSDGDKVSIESDFLNWERTTYDNGEIQTLSKEFFNGEQQTLPTAITRFGYEFLGWFDSEDEQVEEITINGYTRVVAKWNAIKSKATFVANTGLEKDQSVTNFDNGHFLDEDNEEIFEITYDMIYRQVFGEIKTPERKGYEFAGWFDSEVGGIEYLEESIYNFDQDKKFYARWYEKTYEIVFEVENSQGANISFNQTNIQTQIVESKTVYTITAKVTANVNMYINIKQGYEFRAEDYTVSEEYDFIISENQNTISVSRFIKNEKFEILFASKLNKIEIEINNVEMGSVTASVTNLIDANLRAEEIEDIDRVVVSENLIIVWAFSGEKIELVTTAQKGYKLETVLNITNQKLEKGQTGNIIIIDEDNVIFENFVSENVLEVIFVSKTYKANIAVGKDITKDQISKIFGSFAINKINEFNEIEVIENNQNKNITSSEITLKTNEKLEIQMFANTGFKVSEKQAQYIFENLIDQELKPTINFERLVNENILVIEEIWQDFSLMLVYERILQTLETQFLLFTKDIKFLPMEESDAGEIEFMTAFEGLEGEYYFETNVAVKANIDKQKYTFIGWKESINGPMISNNEQHSIVLNGNKTLYAVVSLNKYVVKYSVVGGEGIIDASNTVFEVEHGENLGVVKAQASKGYHFVRWEIYDNLLEEWIEDIVYTTLERQDLNITQNMEIRSVFEGNTIIVGITSRLIENVGVNGSIYAEIQNKAKILLEGTEDWFTDKEINTRTGETFILQIEMEKGYEFLGWGNFTGVEQLSEYRYEFVGYLEDFSLNATFIAKENQITIGFVKVESQESNYEFSKDDLRFGGSVYIEQYSTDGQNTNIASAQVRTGQPITFNLKIKKGYERHLNNDNVYVGIRTQSGDFIRLSNDKIIYNADLDNYRVIIDGELINSELVIAMFVEILEYEVKFHTGIEERITTLMLTVETDVKSVMNDNGLMGLKRQGYEFNGWHTSPYKEDLASEFIDESGKQIMLWTPNITDIFARWERKTVIINILYVPGTYAMTTSAVGYEINDNINFNETNRINRFGYYVGTEDEVTTVKFSVPDGLPGYLFNGWYIDGELVSVDDFYILLLPNDFDKDEITIQIRYAVRIQVDASQYGEGFINGQKEVYLLEGEEAILTVVSEAGYEFVEWRKREGSSTTLLSNQNTFKIAYQQRETRLVPVFDGKKVEIIIEGGTGGSIERVLVENSRDLLEINGKYYAKMGERLYFTVNTNIGLRHVGFMVNQTERSTPNYVHQISVSDTETGKVVISPVFNVRTFNYRVRVSEGGLISMSDKNIANNTVLSTNYFETIKFKFWATPRYKYSDIYIIVNNQRVEIPRGNISNEDANTYIVDMPASLFGVDAENTIYIEFIKLYWEEVRTEFEGSGTEVDPYIISSQTQFAMMQYLVNNNIKASAGKVDYIIAYYKVVLTIDFAERFWIPIGTEENPFAGTIWLDYARHNIFLDKRYEVVSHGGLFGYLAPEAVINEKEVEIRTGILIIISIIVGLGLIGGAFIVSRRIKRKRFFERSISYGSDKRRLK